MNNVTPDWDIILAGGGLANGLIAWRLRQRQPGLRILLIESADAPGGNHTWSFHQDDITPEQHAWLAPLVAHRWHGYDVQFPAFSRTLPGDYFSITSAQFAAVLSEALGETLLTRATVSAVSPQTVVLEDGRRFHARVTIDGRGYQPSPHLSVGHQAFVGQQWRLARPHGLLRPLLMDATVEQQNGYRFVYTLPLSADTLLIEDTHYIDRPTLDADRARGNIADYARTKGWTLDALEREERGSLPIALTGDVAAFWRPRDEQPCSGLRAALFHATTGYSLPLAVQLADSLADCHDWQSEHVAAAIRKMAEKHWRQQRFFRLLNRMLFLAAPPNRRREVMQRFYRLDARLIARFYAGQLTVADRARILLGKPPVPTLKALRAALTFHSRLRA